MDNVGKWIYSLNTKHDSIVVRDISRGKGEKYVLLKILFFKFLDIFNRLLQTEFDFFFSNVIALPKNIITLYIITVGKKPPLNLTIL